MSDGTGTGLDIEQQATAKPTLSSWQILLKTLLVISGLALGALAGIFICLYTGLIDFSC